MRQATDQSVGRLEERLFDLTLPHGFRFTVSPRVDVGGRVSWLSKHCNFQSPGKALWVVFNVNRSV